MGFNPIRSLLARASAFCLVAGFVSACGPSRNYVILVTATPHGVAATGTDEIPNTQITDEVAPTVLPVFLPTPNPTRSAIVDPTQDQAYLVQSGDTLGQIAQRFGVTVEAITVANHLTTDILSVGQSLIVPTAIQSIGPAFKVIPDSELVYGPSVRNFNAEVFLANRTCFLCQYSEELDGRLWTGPQIINRVALEQSINPRLLLALLEYESGWVSQTMISEDAALYPMHYLEQPSKIYGLYRQLDWSGKMLATGFYGWQLRGLSATLLSDGVRVGLDPSINAGTAGVQVLLSQTRTYDRWMIATQQSGVFTTYVGLFGDPFQYAVEPLVPPDITQPQLSFPWDDDETWYFTGGPHGGWGSGSAWSSLDFVAGPEVRGCEEAPLWARAVADGVIARSEYGMVILDLDGDGFEGTGWNIVYLHVSSNNRQVSAGQVVEMGEPIAHPSCEGGVSYATHLHIGRRYNGVWISADCSQCLLATSSPPLTFDGWTAQSYGREYDGALILGDAYREACTCREPINTLGPDTR